MSTVQCDVCKGTGDLYDENMDGALVVMDCGSCCGYGYLNELTVRLHTPEAVYAVDIQVSEVTKDDLYGLCSKLNKLIPEDRRIQLTVEYHWE